MTRTSLILLMACTSLGVCSCKRSQAQVTLDNAAATATNGPTTAAGADLSGNYTISSSHNPGSTSGYKGSASIDKRGDVYRVHWTAGSAPYHGVAIETGSTLAVGWGRGKAYGVLVYTIDGGTLHGMWANLDSDKLGTEDLSGPTGLNGDYTITKATNPSGKGAYTGQVKITPTGSTYAVAWKLSTGDSYAGVGIKDGDKLIVGWGTAGSEAGAVDYKISGSTLEGSWATPGGSQLGGETLSRK